MSGTGPDGFDRWLLAAIAGDADTSGVAPGAAGTVQDGLAKFAGAAGIQVKRSCRNGGRVDVTLTDGSGARWAVIAGLDRQDRVTSLWVQREPAAFAGTAGGLVVVLNGPSSSGKSTLATAIQDSAGTPWIRFLPDEFFQWHLPERYWTFGRAAGPWQEGFFGALTGLARPGNQVITTGTGLGSQAGWRRRLDGTGCLFVGLTPSLAVCERRERARDDRMAGNAAREWPTVHQGWSYDLEIDTGTVGPGQAAALVLAALDSRAPEPLVD
jgi:chloramphenicol 3-O phosphotransferase